MRSILLTLAVTGAAISFAAPPAVAPTIGLWVCRDCPSALSIHAPGAIASAMATADTAGLDSVRMDLITGGPAKRAFAAFLYADSDTVIGCTGWDFSQPETIEPCDRMAVLLRAAHPEFFPQDTITRSIGFSWASQAVADDYNIVVTNASTFLAVLDTILSDTVLVWTAGQVDSLYWVKGAARYRGAQAAFGDSTQFGFPGPVILAPVAPIAVDTLP